VPAIVLALTETVATPLALVVAVVLTTAVDAPALGAVKVTVLFGTTLPNWSLTNTCN